MKKILLMATMFLSFGFSNAQSYIYKETPSSWIRVGKCGATGFFWGVAGEVLVLDFNPRIWTTSS